jgi:hypothetical protein
MKYLKTLEQFLFENNDNKVFETVIKAPHNGFSKIDLENLLRKHRDLEIIYDDANGNGTESYFITPYMHINGKIEGANDTTFLAADKKGKESELKYKNVTSIKA